MRRGVPLSSSMARTQHRVGAAVTGTAQPPRQGVVEAPPCKNRDGWHQMFLIPTRGRVVTPERTDDPERTPDMTWAGGENVQPLGFPGPRHQQTETTANAVGFRARRQDRSDDGFMRSNMIAWQLRLTEGVVLGRRFAGSLRTVNVTSLVVAVATLKKSYFGVPSGAFAAHHPPPLCLGGRDLGVLVGALLCGGGERAVGLDRGGGGSRRSPRNEAWFSPFPVPQPQGTSNRAAADHHHDQPQHQVFK